MNRIPKQALQVLETLEEHGQEAYLVGGCVRDLLLGKIPDDWDMTTSARPEKTLELFHGYAIPTGLQHGTVTVVLDGMHFEVTTYRVDGAYLDHRRPEEVTFTRSLEEDLKRRDFTINAMAMDRRGTVKDFFSGREDLKCGVIRCVGEPEKRFSEDALRIMRAIRFSASLGFPIEERTEKALRMQKETLRNIAMERIRVELLKLLKGRDVVRVLLSYPDILGVFIPEILPSVKCDQRNFHHCYDVWEHIVRTVGYCEPTEILRMTMLLHDIGKPACMTVDENGVGHFRGHAEAGVVMSRDILERLRFDHASAERILTLIKWHDIPVERTERSVRHLLNKLGLQNVQDLFKVKRADNLAQAPEFLGRQQEIDELEEILTEILKKDACFSRKQLAVKGNDLTELGCEGQTVGQILQRLLDAVIDEEVPNEKDALLDMAQKLKLDSDSI